MTHPATSPETVRPITWQELKVATRLAREAGAIVRTFYQVPPNVRWKDPTEPVTEADRAVNAYLVKQLAWPSPTTASWPRNPRMISARLQKSRVWIIDPLDGTMEFIAHNGEFCIMIGLAVGGEPVVGVVYQPIDDVLYCAAAGTGAFVEEFGERYPLRVHARGRPRGAFGWSSAVRIGSPLIDAIMQRAGIQKVAHARQRGPQGRA